MITVRFGAWCGRTNGGGARRDSFKRGLGGNSDFAFWKCVGLFSQTSELLCSSSLEGQAKKSGGKVPLASSLRPHGGLRRGRARFPGKHWPGLGGCAQPVEMGAAGRRSSPGRRPQEAPSLHPSSRKRRLERPGCSPGCFKSCSKLMATGAQPRTPVPAAELPPCSATRTPAPSAAGPTRPATSPPAWPSPGPRTFPNPTSALRRRRGRRVRSSPARWILGPLGEARGVGRRRARPADSNFVALGPAQSSLPRGAGGAARAVTQQLARWRAGPCSRPPALSPVPPAPRALGGGHGQPAAEPAPLWGRLAAAGSFPRRRRAVEPVLRLDREKVALGFRPREARGGGRWFRHPGELGIQEKDTQRTKGWGRRKRKFFSSVLRLEGHVRRQSALCFAK